MHINPYVLVAKLKELSSLRCGGAYGALWIRTLECFDA